MSVDVRSSAVSVIDTTEASTQTAVRTCRYLATGNDADVLASTALPDVSFVGTLILSSGHLLNLTDSDRCWVVSLTTSPSLLAKVRTSRCLVTSILQLVSSCVAGSPTHY